VQPADRKLALQSADSVFTLVSEQAPDSYLGEMWRARTNSAMDPETTDGLAKPYYEKVMDMLLSKNEPKYNSALIECYSYLGYYYLLKSDYPTSKEFWNKILAIDPTNATAKKALEGIK
jgi:tetratricopeptide (TPR) repeat protein